MAREVGPRPRARLLRALAPAAAALAELQSEPGRSQDDLSSDLSSTAAAMRDPTAVAAAQRYVGALADALVASPALAVGALALLDRLLAHTEVGVCVCVCVLNERREDVATSPPRVERLSLCGARGIRTRTRERESEFARAGFESAPGVCVCVF